MFAFELNRFNLYSFAIEDIVTTIFQFKKDAQFCLHGFTHREVYIYEDCRLSKMNQKI